ncbi:DUF11 domain-containing protein, partial [Flavobacterium sp. KDG-16]|nr:DUF11 domain-containing protein [Flavobacterium difficile]
MKNISSTSNKSKVLFFVLLNKLVNHNPMDNKITNFFFISKLKVFKKFALIALLFVSSNLFAQSFVFNMSGQSFSFLNANRTLLSGTGNTAGSIHRYDNVATVSGRVIYARVTIVSTTNATIGTFDQDAAPGTAAAFQPIINTTAAAGVAGFASYRFEFFDTLTNIPAYLYNFNLSGLDIDGVSANQRELYQIRDYSNYQVDNTTGLTVTPAGTFTQFLGLTTSLPGITFENTASFISFYGNSKTSIDVNLGSTGTNANRQMSMVLGVAPGTFTTPQTTSNAAALTQTDLQVTKTASSFSPIKGGTITFTLTARNNGTSNATGVQVSDILPNGYTFTSATPSVGTYNNATGFWTIGTMNNGATETLTINATVNETGNYSNSAGITGNEIDPNTNNNGSTVTPVPVSQTNLGVIKTINNPNPPVGSSVQFTITASNSGLSNATGVIVNDLLPSGYTFTSAVPSVGSYNTGTGVWNIGNFLNGANATLTINATVNATGNFTNTASISGNETDPNTANNSSSVSIPINLMNTCPSNTVNLNTALMSNAAPSGSVLTWHTGTPATNANLVSDPTTVVGGTYYASFYDTANMCYGPVSGIVNVSVTPCSNPPVANDDDQSATPLTEDGADGTVSVLANDTDVDGNPSAPVNGV